MEYITIGTDTLLEEYFLPVVNSDKIIKPAGGIWCSLYRSASYNEWLDFISNKPLYMRRYINYFNPGKIGGAIITPKEDANVLTLDNAESFAELEKGYKFDFEKVAEDYDAIYYDLFRLTGAVPAYEYTLRRFISINTFLVLNPNAIKEYKKAVISVDGVDLDYGYCPEILTNTTILDGTYQMEGESVQFKAILDQICVGLKDEIYQMKLNHRDVPTFIIVDMIRKRIKELYGKEIMEYCKSKDYDNDRIITSLATRSYKRTK